MKYVLNHVKYYLNMITITGFISWTFYLLWFHDALLQAYAEQKTYHERYRIH